MTRVVANDSTSIPPPFPGCAAAAVKARVQITKKILRALVNLYIRV